MKISKKQIFSFLILSFFTFLVFVFQVSVPQVNAQPITETRLYQGQVGMDEIQTAYGGQAPRDIRLTVVEIIKWGLSLLGLIFLILIIFAGFKWMTSGGNEEDIKKAQKLLTNSIIGLIIILAAWSITVYLIRVFRANIIEQTVDSINVY